MTWTVSRDTPKVTFRSAGLDVALIWGGCSLDVSRSGERARFTFAFSDLRNGSLLPPGEEPVGVGSPLVPGGGQGEGPVGVASPLAPGEGQGEGPVDGGAGSLLSARARAHGVSATIRVICGDQVTILGRIENRSEAPVSLHSLLIRLVDVDLGGSDLRHLAFFKNGYQSWTATRAFASLDRERRPWLRAARLMQDNLHNLPTCRRGQLRSEMFTVIGDNEQRRYLLFGQFAGFEQFLYIQASFSEEGERFPLDLVLDLGGQQLEPGAAIDLDRVCLMAGQHPNRLVDAYLESIHGTRPLRSELPVGWCTWYYYYTRVSERDVVENLESAAEHGVDWHYFQLDDGYQTAVGDWLSFNRKFGQGLKPLAKAIHDRGRTAGLWLAPFLASSRSALFREHPEWCLKNAAGRPLSAGLNPSWGLGGKLRALDTTHPGFQEYLDRVIRTLVHDFGFEFLKLDFLYAACLHGRAHDPTVSPAGRLKLGYDIIRGAAGESVFLLGCGAPLSPSIGKVDGMRIGPDVAAFWFPTLRYHVTRDPNALCARFAVRNMLNRSQLHRRLWLNDPDCLLIRESETKLSLAERRTLANAIVVTGGLLLISDRLAAWSEALWEKSRLIEGASRACFGGRTWPLDFMEREAAELVYNSAGYLAIFNFSSRAVHKLVPLQPYLEGLVEPGDTFASVWDDRQFRVGPSFLDLGTLDPHDSILLKRE